MKKSEANAIDLARLMETYVQAAQLFAERLRAVLQSDELSSVQLAVSSPLTSEIVTTCTLKQWVLDREGMFHRLNEAILSHSAILVEATDDRFCDFLAVSEKHYRSVVSICKVVHGIASRNVDGSKLQKHEFTDTPSKLDLFRVLLEEVGNTYLGPIKYRELEGLRYSRRRTVGFNRALVRHSQRPTVRSGAGLSYSIYWPDESAWSREL